MANDTYTDFFWGRSRHSPFIRYSLLLVFIVSGCSGSGSRKAGVLSPPPASPRLLDVVQLLDVVRATFVHRFCGDQPASIAYCIAYRNGKLYICDGGPPSFVWDLETGRAQRLGLGDEKLTEPVAVAAAMTALLTSRIRAW
jgi:hypothetical protein